MKVTVKRLALAVTLTLLTSSPSLADEVYQWTDVNGVVHFTDSLDSVPKSARKSSSFVARKFMNYQTTAPNITEVVQSSPAGRDTEQTLEPLPAQPEPVPVVYAPQEVMIVVVNSGNRQPKRHSGKADAHRKPAFRPDFNNRQYIHPSVFNGGSRQYIHPR
ncbi:MAG: DUF4124 domain-containing protein [Candidatus Binatia bacterium]